MKFAGLWHITEMEMWDADYLNMETQAYLRIEHDGRGNFQFGLVEGYIDGEVEEIDGQERFVFSWEGSDELDPVLGNGWVKFSGTDRLIGRIKIHLGDSSGLEVVKVE